MSNLVYVDLISSPPPDLRNAGRAQPWRVRVISGDNQRVLFVSSEHYTNRADALAAAQLAFGPGANVYLREPERDNVLLRQAAPDLPEPPD